MNFSLGIIILSIQNCSFTGAPSLLLSLPMCVTVIVDSDTAIAALAGPMAMKPLPAVLVLLYNREAELLLSAVGAVASEQIRAYLAVAYLAGMQMRYIVRSMVFNFRNPIIVQLIPGSADTTALVLWSRSVVRKSDLRVRGACVAAWLTALHGKSPNSSEK
jgi:hypothetical protein